MFTLYIHVTWVFIYIPKSYIYASIYDCIYVNIKYFFLKTVQTSGSPFVLFCHPLAVRTGISPSPSRLYEMFKGISFSLLNPRNSFLCILRAFRALSPTAVCPGPVDLSCLSHPRCKQPVKVSRAEPDLFTPRHVSRPLPTAVGTQIRR